MRDIRPLPPGQRKRRPRRKPETPKKASSRLTGATVGVTNIHLPKPPREAPAAVTTTTARKKPKAKRRARRVGPRERSVVLGLLGLLAIVVLLVAIIFWPRADIDVIIRTAPLLVDEQLTIAAQESEETVAGTTFFREIPVSGEAPVATEEVVGAKATGTVRLVNRTVEEQPIREGSRLETEAGDLFFMQQSAVIPAGDGGTLGAVSVQIEAAEAGAEFNIEAQRLNFVALDESSQTLVYAEVDEALTGGSGETTRIVRESDLTAAQEAAGMLVQAQVMSEIEAELPKDWVLLDESWEIVLSEFTTEVAEGAQLDVIPFTARASAQVIGYDKLMLEERLQASLAARLDEGFELFPGAIAYTTEVDVVDFEAGEADITVQVTHTTIPDLSLASLREKIAGRSGEEATAYLEGLPGVQSVDLQLSPFWVRSVPRIEDRVKLELRPETAP